MKIDRVLSELALGERLNHEETRISLKLVNSSGVPLSIAYLKTSCGCTAAVVQKDSLANGESTDLLLRISPSGEAPFSTEIRFHTELGWHKLAVRMQPRYRVDIPLRKFVVEPDAKFVDVDIVRHDHSIDFSDIQLQTHANSQLERIDNDTFRVPMHENESTIENQLVVVSHKNDVITSVDLEILRRGHVRIEPSNVYYVQNGVDAKDRPHVVRLFLVGDCSSFGSGVKASLIVDGKPTDCTPVVRQLGPTLEYNFSLTGILVASHECILVLGDKQFPFHLEPR